MGKTILAWLKANVITVIMGVLVLILPPAGVVGASLWNAGIGEGVKKALESEQSKIKSAAKVTYAVPSIAPGEEGWQASAAPNQAMIDFVASERARRVEQVERVVTQAVRINRGMMGRADPAGGGGGGKRLLVDGLFPGSGDARAEAALIDRLLDVVAVGGAERSVYERLLESVNAGGPVSASTLSGELQRTLELERGRIEGLGLNQAQVQEQVSALSERLIGTRIASVRQRAQQISLYATLDAIGQRPEEPGTRRAGGGPGPGGRDRGDSPVSRVPVYGLDPDSGDRPTLGEAFLWQWDYWMIEDLVRAIAQANSDEQGLRLDVTSAPVKWLMRVNLLKPEARPAGEGGFGGGGFGGGGFGGGGGRGFGGGGGGTDPGAQAQAGPGLTVDPEGLPLSHTGVGSGSTAQGYDVRRGAMLVVVEVGGLPRLLDAIERSNFIRVTGVDLGEVNIAEALEAGFYFGERPVVTAQIEFESAWLRQWTAPAMPRALRDALGVVLPEPADEQGGSTN